MNFPFGILSTDFDGTLYAEFETPPIPARLERTIGWLQAQGVSWVINTGRDLSSLGEALDHAGVAIRPDYVVTVEREIYRRQGSDYIALEDWNQRCGLAHETVFSQVRRDVARLGEWITRRLQAKVYADAYSPLCLIAPAGPEAEPVYRYLNEYCLSVPNLSLVRNGVYARLGHSEFNKGSALAEISRRLGVNSHRVVAAGDHLNDLPMLSSRLAKWLIAPGNAVEEVKELVRQQEGYVSVALCGDGVQEGLEYVLDRCRSNR